MALKSTARTGMQQTQTLFFWKTPKPMPSVPKREFQTAYGQEAVRHNNLEILPGASDPLDRRKQKTPGVTGLSAAAYRALPCRAWRCRISCNVKSGSPGHRAFGGRLPTRAGRGLRLLHARRSLADLAVVRVMARAPGSRRRNRRCRELGPFGSSKGDRCRRRHFKKSVETGSKKFVCSRMLTALRGYVTIIMRGGAVR